MEDKVIWGATSDGRFSVKSAYRLNFSENSSSCYPWLKNWFLRIPPKLKIFLWLAVDGKLMTNQQRWIRHFSPDADCPFCPGITETLTHLLRDCPRAVLVWKSLSIPVNMGYSFRLDCRGWFFANLLQGKCLFGEVPWNVLFSFCCWHLWKWRCKAVFDNSFCFPYNVQQVIWNCVLEWWKASAVKRKIILKHEELLHWIKPSAGVFKINVDGSRSLGGCIGAGGVIRDCLGTWHGGFMVNLGAGEVLLAEAWGLFHGLHLALRCGADHIEVESDSASLVKLVQDRMFEVHPLGTIISNCIDLMKKFSSCSLIHIFRERNRVADLLAKASLNMELGECFLEEVPVVAAEAVLDDINGVAKARVIPAQPSLHDKFGDTDTSCRQFGSAGAADVQISDAGESHTPVYGQNAMVAAAVDVGLPGQLIPDVHGLGTTLLPHWLRPEGMVDNGTVLPRQNGDAIAARLHNQGADGLCSLPAFIAQFGTECVAEECDANKGDANAVLDSFLDPIV